MKCLYYITSTLDSAHHISDDLHEAGVDDWFFHVVSKDESGLKREHIHSGNYLEKLDILRDGIIGAMMGFIAGVLLMFVVMATEPFGPDVKSFVYLGIVFVVTCFGAWSGGLIGIESENKKMAEFHDDIEAGKYLILIYARKKYEALIQSMMEKKHPEAKLVASDANFFNPLTSLKRVA